MYLVSQLILNIAHCIMDTTRKHDYIVISKSSEHSIMQNLVICTCFFYIHILSTISWKIYNIQWTVKVFIQLCKSNNRISAYKSMFTAYRIVY